MRRKNWHGSRPESMFFELNTDRPDGEKKHAVAKRMRKMAAAAVFAFVTAAAFCTTGVRSYAFNLGPGMENYNIQIYQEQPENNPAYNNGWTSNIGPGGTGSNPGGGIDSEKDYAYSKGPGYDEVVYQIANNGYPVILCNVGNFYMDMAYNGHPDERGRACSQAHHPRRYNRYHLLLPQPLRGCGHC